MGEHVLGEWGGKQEHGRDGLIAGRVAERLGLPLFETGLVGEQGGVEHDGAGLVLARASSWLGAGRNDLSLATIGDRLCAAFGGSRMIWGPGLADQDITDFHIDALARFTAPGKLLIQIGDEPVSGDLWGTDAIAEMGGGIHCATQQQPRSRST